MHSDDTEIPVDGPVVDGADVRRVIEYYYEQGWTDGLPGHAGHAVVPRRVPGHHGQGPGRGAHADAAPEQEPDGADRRAQRGAGRLPARVPPRGARRVGRVPRGRHGVPGDLAVDHRHGAVLRALRAAAHGARVQRARQRVGVGVPGQRHGRPGHQARRDQRPRPQAARVRPGDPGQPGQVLLLHRGERGGLPLAVARRRPRDRPAGLGGDLHGHPLGAAHRGQAHDRAQAAGDGLRRLAVPHRRAGAGERAGFIVLNPEHARLFDKYRLVQGRRPAGDRRLRLAAATGTSRRPARRRSRTAPAGGCPPTTRTPYRRRCPRTWTPPSS